MTAWTKAGNCPKCGAPIFGNENELGGDIDPRVKFTCDCKERCQQKSDELGKGLRSIGKQIGDLLGMGAKAAAVSVIREGAARKKEEADPAATPSGGQNN